MNETRKPHERLDALLTGLEEEVLRRKDASTTDIGAMRSSMELLIVGIMDPKEESPRAVVDVKGKLAGAVERLGRWANMVQGYSRADIPRVKMAFSGKQERPVRRSGRRGARTGRSSKGNTDGQGS